MSTPFQQSMKLSTEPSAIVKVNADRVKEEKYAKAEAEAERILEKMGDGMLEYQALRDSGVDGRAWMRWKTAGANQRRYAEAHAAMGSMLIQRKYLEAVKPGVTPEKAWEATVEFLRKTMPNTYGDRQTVLSEVKVIPHDTPEELRMRLDEIRRQYGTNLIERKRVNERAEGRDAGAVEQPIEGTVVAPGGAGTGPAAD